MFNLNNLHFILSKVKEFVKQYQAEIILFLGVALACFFSFFLGYIMAKINEKRPLEIEFSCHRYLISSIVSPHCLQ